MSPAAPTTDATHTFQVVFLIPGADSLEPHLDALHAAGCDDASFMGPAADGSFTAEFDREAPTFTAVVVSALDAILFALPDAQLPVALENPRKRELQAALGGARSASRVGR